MKVVRKKECSNCRLYVNGIATCHTSEKLRKREPDALCNNASAYSPRYFVVSVTERDLVPSAQLR